MALPKWLSKVPWQTIINAVAQWWAERQAKKAQEAAERAAKGGES